MMGNRFQFHKGLLSLGVSALLTAAVGLTAASQVQAAPNPPDPSHHNSTAITVAEARYAPASGNTGTQSASLDYRHSWGARNGEQVLRLTNMPVSNGQTVLVTVTEGTPPDVSIGGRIGLEFVGSAKIALNNVSVEDGAVRIWVTINWGSPVPLYVHYVIP